MKQNQIFWKITLRITKTAENRRLRLLTNRTKLTSAIPCFTKFREICSMWILLRYRRDDLPRKRALHSQRNEWYQRSKIALTDGKAWLTKDLCQRCFANRWLKLSSSRSSNRSQKKKDTKRSLQRCWIWDICLSMIARILITTWWNF